MGTINFWMSTFILPKGCIKRIESLCARFLWSGNILGHARSKVAWHKLALPKEEGGIGMRNLLIWNKSLVLRLIWLLFVEKESLWAEWHKKMNVRCKSLWLAKESRSNTWTWNHILRLRPLATEFIRCRLGNGCKASFWLDTWSPFGQLITLYGDTGPLVLQVPINSSVSDVVSGAHWNLPAPRTRTDQLLQDHLDTLRTPLPNSQCDIYDWVVQGKSTQGFSTKNTWEALRPRAEVKDWSKLVWFKGAVPKHAYNMWLVQLNRLPTRNRLLKWGLINDDACCICSNAGETREHLFLTCSFAREILRINFSRTTLGQSFFRYWEELLAWTRVISTTSPSQLRKLVSQATVFHVWKQRNNVLHNGEHISATAIFKEIDRDVKGSITPRRRDRRFRNLMPIWLR